MSDDRAARLAAIRALLESAATAAKASEGIGARLYDGACWLFSELEESELAGAEREDEVHGRMRAELAAAEEREARLREALTHAAGVLRNRDRTSHRGLQWAFDLAGTIEAALLDAPAKAEP